MSTTCQLLESSDNTLWKDILNKTQKEDMYPQIQSDREFITKEQHMELLEWKMKNTTFRPILRKYAKELPEGIVEETSRAAFALGRDGKYMDAIKKYTELKGTGWALASLIIATQFPDVPWMSDELLHVLYEKPKYTNVLKRPRDCNV